MSPQAGWILQEEVVLRLKSAIPNAVPFIAPEDAQELIQDGTAMAANMIHNAEQAGKKVVRYANGRPVAKQVTAGNIAYYTIVNLRNGSRSTGSTVADVHGAGTQSNGNTRLMSLEEVVASDEHNGGEIFELHDVLSNDQEDPATKAARKMDWDSFTAGLSERDQAIIECLVEGKPLNSLARANGPTYRKEHLAKAIQEFMGSEILVDIQRRPKWKDGLTATSEKLACREERRHC